MEGYKELIGIARRDNGLENLGDDSFEQGLEILVKAMNAEANLNPVGEGFVRSEILKYLRQRLEIEEWYRQHPETEDIEIGPQLFGVSLPRTGSTALSFLLSSDPGIRYLRQWESAQPYPPPSTVEGPDPRRGAAQGVLGKSGSASKFTPSGIDGAYECQDLMALSFASHLFIAYAKVPTYNDWLLDADLTATYEYERRALKMLQYGEPVRPWRLKCPTHIVYMDYLDRAFPKARFVMTHRDPTDVILSVATVYAELHRHFTDNVDMHYVGEMNVNNWATGMERLTAFRDRPGNDARFYDIHFRAMQDDPVGEVRGLYQWLGEPVTPAFEEGMTAFWEENEARERFDKPDPSAFGIDYDAVRGRFAGYLERMEKWAPYPRG